jgi:hypothetical protein
MPVQLRFDTGLAGAEYVTRQAWRLATLPHCPLHPGGGCGFARHGTYARKTPAGTLVARWYCRLGHCTFSLLPDHLAARFPGTLGEIEHAVAAAEAAPSLEACADALRRDAVGLDSALRWLRRRLDPVRALLPLVLTLLPEALQGCAPSLAALRRHLGLGGECVLEHLRRRLGEVLGALASPLGFRRRGTGGGAAVRGPQQPMGPDPPAAPG